MSHFGCVFVYEEDPLSSTSVGSKIRLNVHCYETKHCGSYQVFTVQCRGTSVTVNTVMQVCKKTQGEIRGEESLQGRHVKAAAGADPHAVKRPCQ